MMASSRRIEHALVASVRREHLHGLRIGPRLRRWCCAVASAPSLLWPLLASGLFSFTVCGPIGCGQGCRWSFADDLRVSLLVLRSGGLSDCLAALGVSFGCVISLLFSALSDVLEVADVEPSSFSEPEGRLLIERCPDDDTFQDNSSRDSDEAVTLLGGTVVRRSRVAGGSCSWMARALRRDRLALARCTERATGPTLLILGPNA